MTPKITSLMAKNAIEDGAEVREKRAIKRPAPPVTPIPAPESPKAAPDRRVEVMEASMTQQLIIAQKQAEELTRLVEELSADKPVRFKVHRNMDRASPAYLLLEYIDVIPLKFTRKLDS